MIGWICISTTPYYDSKVKRNLFKRRPVLVIGGTLSNDYTVLPVSTVSKRENLHPVYDIEIDPLYYPGLNLNKVSFVRVHKQTIVHKAAIVERVSNLKSEYPDLYQTILNELSGYNKVLMESAR